MNNKNYYISRDDNKNELVYLEYEKIDGYSVKPKVHKKDEIEVSKIVFVNPEFSEKIIRKKIEKKIESLLKQLKKIEEENDSDEGNIKRTLMDAEKLRLQIINNYVKYLGNTYGSLTIEKLKLITEQLRYRLYILNEFNKENYYSNNIESRRGR